MRNNILLILLFIFLGRIQYTNAQSIVVNRLTNISKERSGIASGQAMNLPGNRKLVWQDEFDYLGLPDSSKWSYEEGGNGWGNNELQYYTTADTANARVIGGKLMISARQKNPGKNQYSSARMVSKNKKGWQYGKIEISAKLPGGRGTWPAIWMLAENCGKLGWPLCGEIDIMEHVGHNPDTVFGTVHTAAYNHTIRTQKGKGIIIKEPYTTFHRYAIDWTYEKIDFLLDDQVYFTVLNEKKTVKEWPFDAPFYLLMNIAVGGGWGGQKGVDNTIFPATMEIDYVRVYE